ncbi:hypothetical protein GCM10022415_28940 [Knoellia locipacati]|uniref:Uncharacterized protein n=1 Tax=Knoellia locipacati TaxID=882824 RepID=A0A512T4P4_9MICO|nr:hypothetical protein [Knoellia locipacati]GEQ15133.1 hypothetical protein KLO01_31800 [Knoellia locipacati]
MDDQELEQLLRGTERRKEVAIPSPELVESYLKPLAEEGDALAAYLHNSLQHGVSRGRFHDLLGAAEVLGVPKHMMQAALIKATAEAPN